MKLPVARPWYGCQPLDGRTWRLTEPHVHPVYAANIYLVLGRDSDLVIDSGMGVAPLRPVLEDLRPDRAKPLTLLTTHAHWDHFGAAHAFETHLAHPLEAPDLAAPETYRFDTAEIGEAFRQIFRAAGYPEFGPLLIDAVPWAGYDVDAYRLQAAPPTRLVTEGDVIDLGDWQAEVLELPGHASGQIGLWHAPSGTVFSADAVYDGPLLYEGAGTSIPDYAATLRRLRSMPVRRVLGGHEDPIDGVRMREVIERYLAIWGV